MAIINKADFARLAGVSRMAVTLGCRRGNLAAMPDGHIDTEDPTNKKYLQASRKPGRRILAPEKKPEKRPEKQRVKNKKPADKKPPLKILPMPDQAIEARQPPRGMKPEESSQLINLKERKDMADIRLKNSQADRHIQARAERMGLLVLRSEVDKILAVLGAELRTRLLDMPRRITPQIVALVQSGSDAREIETILDTEITDAVKHAKETAHRAGVKDF